MFLGPSVSAMCGAVAGVLTKSTVNYCYSPAIHPPPGSYQFLCTVGDHAQLGMRGTLVVK